MVLADILLAYVNFDELPNIMRQFFYREMQHICIFTLKYLQQFADTAVSNSTIKSYIPLNLFQQNRVHGSNIGLNNLIQVQFVPPISLSLCVAFICEVYTEVEIAVAGWKI
jgi:CRISPR/Cas system-associated exonuclease Cas4 (RecB family)